MANDSENKEGAGDSKLEKDGAMKSLVQVESLIQLALMLPVATVVGWLIGTGLDHWLHTSWLYIVGLLLGIVAGFVELIRTVVKDNKSSGQ